jgi:hypothetical protein
MEDGSERRGTLICNIPRQIAYSRVKPTYGTAVLWLIANERLDWINDPAPTFPDTVVMVAELFGVSQLQILNDIKATLDTAGK